MRGAERVAVELAAALDGLGTQNSVIAISPAFDGTLDARMPALVNRTNLDVLAILAAARRLRRRLRLEPVDVVLAHGGSAAQVASLAKSRRGPFVVWQRVLPFPTAIWSPVRRTMWRWVARRADAAVALTPELGDELRELGFAGPLWAIGNFRNPDRFATVDRAAARVGLRSELGLDPSASLLGLVGHLIEQKRPQRALDVLALLVASERDVHLVIAGDGPLREKIDECARELGVRERTHLIGRRDDVETVLSALDVLLLTSESEGIPGILIEAQMSGCPVVTYPVGGVAAVVEDGETGVVLDKADPGAMAGAVAALLDDPERARRLGDQARTRSDRFSIHRAAPLYLSGLESLVIVRA